jgi:hypothetical protein
MSSTVYDWAFCALIFNDIAELAPGNFRQANSFDSKLQLVRVNPIIKPNIA